MLDYSEKRDSGFDLIPEGQYECTAKCEGEKIKVSGTKSIALSWRIREDVLQLCQGRVIFDDIYPDKNDPSKYNDRKIYDIIFGGQNQNDPKSRFKFDDYDDLCQYLNGINMLIKVEINEYNGVKRNRVAFSGYSPTKVKGQTLGSTEPAKASEDVDDVLPDDVPF